MDEYRIYSNSAETIPPRLTGLMRELKNDGFDDLRALARERGVPGPDVDEHPDDYDGECYCRLCLSYADWD